MSVGFIKSKGKSKNIKNLILLTILKVMERILDKNKFMI